MTYNYLRAVMEIERLYPPERIARSKDRFTAVWNHQQSADALPFVFSGVPFSFEEMNGGKVYEAGYPREELLAFQLEQIIARVALDDDYIPSLFPGCRQGLIPTAYGAQEEWVSDHYWQRPLLNSAEEAYDLPHPDFSRQGVAAELLENTRFFRNATGGRLPIQMPDMQGPLDLASNMLGTERLLLDMQDHPEAVHHLMKRMTDDFITYMHLQEQASEGTLVPIHCMPTVWIPQGRGMSLSEDMLAVLSPRFYEKFAKPYNERIAAEFGQVVIHSCGGFEHNLPLLQRTKGLLGLNFGISETDIRHVARLFGSNIVILTHGTPVSINNLPLLKPLEFVNFIFDFTKEYNLRVIPIVAPAEGMTLAGCIELSHTARQKAAF